MKLLGIIGGTSWHATVVYYTRINQLAAKYIGEAANPPLLIYSQDITVMRSGEIDRIKASYLSIAKTLENQGAEAIVIAANTPHIIAPYVQEQIGIPILHIADSTAKKAKKKGVTTLGLLGTLPTMTKDFLKARLKEIHNLDTIIPDDKHLEKVHEYISKDLTQGKFTEESKTYFKNQMDLLVEKGAEAIILGCTELPILFKDVDYKVPLLDTTELHVNDAVEFIFKD